MELLFVNKFKIEHLFKTSFIIEVGMPYCIE